MDLTSACPKGKEFGSLLKMHMAWYSGVAQGLQGISGLPEVDQKSADSAKSLPSDVFSSILAHMQDVLNAQLHLKI